MTRAGVTFGGPAAGTKHPIGTVAETTQGVPLQDATKDRATLAGTRANFERAMLEALRSDGQYPYDDGVALLASLGWEKGYSAILESKPTLTRLDMGDETWPLLPEMVPVPPMYGGKWLDAHGPHYRTLGRIGSTASHVTVPSLAILYEDTEEFAKLATAIQSDLVTPGFKVTLLNGSAWSPNPDEWQEDLEYVFHSFRAVTFLGHLFRGGISDNHGWELRPGTGLPMTRVESVLKPPKGVGKFTFSRPVPEVVFPACCAGAWQSPAGRTEPPLAYPKMFLDCGVRHFIGAWMDIAGTLALEQEYFDILKRLIVGFFRRWAEDPSRAVQHLYDAKSLDCKSHLLTSLFQIYAAESPPESESPSADNSPIPAAADGALVGSLATGTVLGPYRLDAVAWKTEYARTFWASANGKRSLVEVPVDAWQGIRDLRQRLENALSQLARSELSPTQLIPDRCELLPLDGSADNLLIALVHDLDKIEGEPDWQPLATRDFDPAGTTHFADVLRLAAGISLAISELHLQGIRHGNLDHDNVLVRAVSREEQVVLKDGWVSLAGLGRCASPQFGAPEEPLPADSPDELKVDIWSLGILLFEMAAGRLPAVPSRRRDDGGTAKFPSVRAALGNLAPRVPSGLERLVRECLAPSPTLRPNSAQVSSALALALRFGGAYVSEFDRDLRDLVTAGQRLIAVLTEEPSNLDSALDGFDQAGHRTFVVEDQVGLVVRRSGEPVLPWVDGYDFYEDSVQKAETTGEEPPAYPTPDQIGALNFEKVITEKFPAITQLGTSKLPPIVLVRGSTWWALGKERIMMLIWRGLRRTQSEMRSPVVIVADRFLSLEQDLSRSFRWLRFPWPSPAELFERILSFVDAERLAIPQTREETAIELAHQLYPCGIRDLTESLRLSALKYGCIDQRVLEVWDELKSSDFARTPGISYIPVAKLPERGHLGLPDEVEDWLADWVCGARAALEGRAPDGLPRRLLISGPEGYGKTTLALLMGRLSGRPVVRIEADSCLRGYLGISEMTFRNALTTAASPQGSLVLIDDVERFFGAPPLIPGVGGQADPMKATVSRMSGILLNWMDRLTPMTTLVMTSADPSKLPDSFQWRVERRLALDGRAKVNGPVLDEPSLTYRARVFAAVLARSGLGPALLTDNKPFLRDLAIRTHPGERAAPLPSPFALASSPKVAVQQVIELRTGAEIESWIQETILLHARLRDPAADPADCNFWLSKT